MQQDKNTSKVSLVPKKPLAMRLEKKLQPKLNKLIAASSKVNNQMLYDSSPFAAIAKLEENWLIIKEEASAILHDMAAIPPLATISPDHRRIAPAGKWLSYLLYGYGYRIADNCAVCPRTAELVAEVPGLNSAFFSILLPGTHIPRHKGFTKAFLTCHLAIKVPIETDKCQMTLLDQKISWQEGKALIFDDTYEHEVLNDTQEARVILMVQFRRPVGFIGKILGGLILWCVKRSRFVQDIRRGLKEWKEYLAQQN